MTLLRSKVLIVDDSETVRDVIVKTLCLAGFGQEALFEASNGEDALRLMGEETFGLVFSDLNMPIMSGVEMITKMKAHDRTRGIPIVVISTDGSQARRRQLQRQGVWAYLCKPFTPEEVRKVVTRILETDDVNG